MGTLKNLEYGEAIKKMREFSDDINICMFGTAKEGLPLDISPMATQKVDDEGNFWFLSQADSDRNKAIEKNAKVQLIYAKTSDTHFMSIYGTAIISRDRKKIDEMWTNIATAWFKEGKDDPNLTLICVKPESAYYWDTKHGKMISLLKIAMSAITAKSSDDGIEGKLKV